MEWGLPVVAKCLFGGLSAGAFVTYYLWQGLGLKAFRSLSKLAWISAAVWGLMIPIPIFGHLGQPGRFVNLLTDFHWTSPMSWAGPILLAYVVVVLINGRFFYYADVVLAYREARGIRRKALRVLLITKPPVGAVPEASRFWLKVTGALGFVLALFFALNAISYVSLSYSPPSVRPAVQLLATGELAPLFLWIGLGLGTVVPMVLLAGNAILKVPRRWLAGLSGILALVWAFAQKYGFLAAGQFYDAPAGETYASLWPTIEEVLQFLAVLALAYFLFVAALWISPWRRVVPEPLPAAPAKEVA